MTKLQKAVVWSIEMLIIYAIPAAVIILGADMAGLDQQATWKEALGMGLVIIAANVSGGLNMIKAMYDKKVKAEKAAKKEEKNELSL